MARLWQKISQDEQEGRAYDGHLIKRLLKGYVWRHRLLLTLILAIVPVAALVQLVPPYLLKVAIDDHITPGRGAGLGPLALIYLLATVAVAGVRFAQTYWLQLLGQRVTHRIRSSLFGHIQDLPQAFFDRNPVGRMLTRVTSDVEGVEEMFNSGVISILGDLFLLLGIMGAMLWLEPRIALITFSAIPVILVVTLWLRPKVRDTFRAVRARLSQLNAFFQEQICGVDVVQLFRKEEETYRDFEGLNRGYRGQCLRSIIFDGGLFALVEVAGAIMVAVILFYGGGEIIRGAVTFGVLVAFIEYIAKFFAPLMDLSAKYTIMQAAMAALERIFGLLDEPPDPALAGDTKKTQASDGKSGISFEGVWFSYDGKEDVLRDVSFHVGPGETVALVGATGAGKSTLFKLLSRLYEIQRGRILLDGVDIRGIPAQKLRRRIGLAMQDIFLFSGDVARNIRLGDESLSDKDLEAVGATVGVDEFIRRFPGGYGEPIRERGHNLSAGERQLLSLARAVARSPEILLIDEATSNLDPSTEFYVQRALSRFFGKTTSLVIAHRLSTVKRADRIIVLHRGEVREMGAHEELLRMGGIYARLYNLQYKGQEPTPPKGGRGPVSATPAPEKRL